MTYDELSDEQKIQVKQWILEKRNENRGEGTSYEELANADDLVSDEDARDWSKGTDFVPEDFGSSEDKADDKGMEKKGIETTVVNDVPQWAVQYLVYADASALDEEDLRLVQDFEEKMLKQGLKLIAPIKGTENSFCPYPAFGLACDTIDFDAEVLKKEES